MRLTLPLNRYPLRWYINVVGGGSLCIDTQPRETTFASKRPLAWHVVSETALSTNHFSVLPPFSMSPYHLSKSTFDMSKHPLPSILLSYLIYVLSESLGCGPVVLHDHESKIFLELVNCRTSEL